MSHDDWRWVIDVDLWGPIHGVEAFLPHLRASGEPGHLLFTASFAGLVPNVGLGPYCVAKYGVVALAEVLHKELRDWVRKEIGPIASPDLIQFAPGLPKTRSGKIMRRILRKIAEDEFSSLGDTSTLADPAVVDDLISNRQNRQVQA